MKSHHFIAIVAAGLLLVGCDKSQPSATIQINCDPKTQTGCKDVNKASRDMVSKTLGESSIRLNVSALEKAAGQEKEAK